MGERNGGDLGGPRNLHNANAFGGSRVGAGAVAVEVFVELAAGGQRVKRQLADQHQAGVLIENSAVVHLHDHVAPGGQH